MTLDLQYIWKTENEHNLRRLLSTENALEKIED